METGKMKMKGCQDYAEYLSAYLDDELSAVELLDMAGHLKACAACSRLMDEMVAVKNLLHQAEPFWPTPSPSERFLPSLKGKLERETGRGCAPRGKRPFGLPSRVVPLAGAALLAALLFAGVVTYLQVRRPEMIASAPGKGGRPQASYLIAQGGAGDNLDEYLREHALESSPNILLEDENVVELANYDLP